MSDDFELAESLVRSAGLLAATMLRKGLETKQKTSISDVVSAADHAAEALIVERLQKVRPDDGLIGEEGAHRPGERTWFIDPVDGTYNFLAGLPVWCSALALATEAGEPATRPLTAEGQTVLGAVYQPVMDLLWIGGCDRPTTLNGDPVAPLVDRPLAEVSIATYLHPPRLADDGLRQTLLRAIAGAATVRMFGSASIEMAMVATGNLGAWLHADSAPWDWYPGAALVLAAGGEVVSFEAGGHTWKVAGNRQAVAELTELIYE